MKLNLFYSLIILLPLFGFAQEVKIKILPFIDATTSIKDGQIEVGPEINWEKVESGKSFFLRPILRMPLTSETDKLIEIDRFAPTWRANLSLQYTQDNTAETGSIKRHSIAAQFEYGASEFKYHPTASESTEVKTVESSYAFEVKYIGFFTKGESGAKQFSPQFRLRYSHDWKAAKEVGV